MLRISIAITLSLLTVAVSAFVVPFSDSVGRRGRGDSHLSFAADNNEVETEAERLIRKARALRTAAEQAEHQVHGDFAKKKQAKDAQTDRQIEELFFATLPQGSSFVDRLRDKRLGMDTLEDIVERLDEREVIAQGLDHVEFKMVGDDKTEAHRVIVSRDEKEVERLDGLIDQLIEGVAVLDEEFLARKKARGEAYMAHAEEEHWGGGKGAERLENRIAEIRRERSEQFQKRSEEFREAQRCKDDPDHKFKGYTDLGNLN